jgi:CheY-like chemotaxis protein
VDLTSEIDCTETNFDAGGGLCILIVEDDADCAESLAMLLRIDGHEVKIAGDGPTAIKMARTNEPDVILLDIGLPGMNGYEIARQLGKPGTTMKPLIIAISGYGPGFERPRLAETEIHFHLTKPVDPVMLQAILKRFQRLVHGKLIE